MGRDFWDFLGGRSYLEMMLDARKFKEKTNKKNSALKVYSFWFDDMICECQSQKNFKGEIAWFLVIRARKPSWDSPYNCREMGLCITKDEFIRFFEHTTGKHLTF